jgi:hypothetical protein
LRSDSGIDNEESICDLATDGDEHQHRILRNYWWSASLVPPSRSLILHSLILNAVAAALKPNPLLIWASLVKLQGNLGRNFDFIIITELVFHRPRCWIEFFVPTVSIYAKQSRL